jgi:membrane protein
LQVIGDTLRQTWDLFRAAFAGWWEDRGMSHGAAIAYYALFSLAPMLLAVVAIAGLVWGREAAEGALVAQIGGLIGEKGAEAIRAMLVSASNRGSGIIGTAVGISSFVILATGALVELQDALNMIFRAPPPARSGLLTFIRTRLLSLALIIAIGFLLLVSLVIDAGVAAVGDYLAGAFPGVRAVVLAVNFVFSLAITSVLFGLIYKVLPDVDLGWRDVALGAVVTALLFAAGKFLIGFYIGKSDLASTYGAAASVITILLWIYYASQIVLFGAEFTRAYAERRRSGAARIEAGPRGAALT